MSGDIKKGDKVECIEPTSRASESFNLSPDEVYVVDRTSPDSIWLVGSSWAYKRNRFRLTENGEEEFKVGDRVEVLVEECNIPIGSMGTIHVMNRVGISLGVELDDPIGPHSLQDHKECRKSCGKWYEPKQLKKLTKQTNKPIKEESNTDIVFDDLTDIQREDMCDLCVDILETDRSRCEGTRCEQAFEMYLENNPNEKEETMSEATVTIESNIFEVFKDTPDMMIRVSDRFKGQYAATDDRTLIALLNDKTKLIAIIKKEDDEKAAAEKAAK